VFVKLVAGLKFTIAAGIGSLVNGVVGGLSKVNSGTRPIDASD
jgi:hypothetical protein